MPQIFTNQVRSGQLVLRFTADRTPFSSQLDRCVEGGTTLIPLLVIDLGGPSFEIFVTGSSETICRSSISMCLEDGTSPLQYRRHMSRYVDSRPRAKFGPLHTGDLAMRSRRLILKFDSAVTSEANCSANCTYSSSFLAIKCSNPALY